MGKFKIFFIYLGVVIVVVAAAFGLYKTSEKQQENLPGQEFEIQGQKHITQGSTDHTPYNSNPPTSGDHWPQPGAWGVYKVTQPDEQLVHNLEHGGIWISYKSDKVDQTTINQLEDFAKRYPKIIVEPREKNDAPIALVAWGHLQNLDQYDETTVLKFISAFYNKGPEKVD